MTKCKIHCNTCHKPMSEDDIKISDAFPMSETYGLCSDCSVAIQSEQLKTWGGPRVAGPGKKIGRPAEAGKRKKVSFSLSPESIKQLDILSGGDVSKSSLVEFYIDQAFKKLTL